MKKIRLPHLLSAILLLVVATTFFVLLQTVWRGNNRPRELPADVSLIISRTAEITELTGGDVADFNGEFLLMILRESVLPNRLFFQRMMLLCQ